MSEADAERRDWDTCSHEWEEFDSMFTNEWKTDVRCVWCRCPGERDEETQEVHWPAT